jgi:uncharacterized peroxidase-related enzyme
MTRLTIAHDGIAPGLLHLFGLVMFAPGELDLAERELVAAVAAAAQDCVYCTESHVEFFRARSGQDALAAAVRERRWRDLDLPPRQRALCEVAEKLSATPTRMVEADWDPLRRLGFDDRACLEVAHVVCLFNYFTRLADGFGLTVDPGTVAAARGAALPAPPSPYGGR